MQRDPRAFLWDAVAAIDTIREFIRGRSLEDYISDALLRSAVERQFEIIGEALSQLSKLAPDMASKVSDLRQIVAFRNLLIHGYASIDHRTVWRATQEHLDPLRSCLSELLITSGDL
jgi:uncharacterized protein with HEPN domain